jgi:hypothetical protein
VPAILLPVGAKDDDRSFRQIGEQAERFFARAGKDASGAFTKEFSDAVQNASPRVQKSFDKIADAIGVVRKEQERLNELQEKGVGGSTLIAQAERLERARRNEARAVREAKTAYDDLGHSVGAVQTALQGFVSGALSRNTFLDPSHIDAAAGALGRVSTGALAAGTGIAAIGVAAAAVGKQFYDLGARWDSITDSITARTGKMGDELASLTGVVKDVGANTALPLENIGDIAAQVSAAMHLTGQPLQDMVQQLASLQQLTGQGVDIRQLGQAFRVGGVDPANYVDEFTKLLGIAQATQMPLNELIGTIQATSKASRELGLSFDDTIGFVASFESAGVDAAKSAPLLAIALKNLAAAGRDPVSGLEQTITAIKQLHDAGQETQAVDLAKTIFGGRGFAEILAPIEDGTLDLQGLDKSVHQVTASAKEQAEATADLSEQWTKFKNNLSNIFEPAATKTFSVINEEIEGGFIQPLQSVERWLGIIKDKAAEISVTPITIDTRLGGMLAPAGGPTAPTPPAPTLGSSLGADPGQLAPGWASQFQWGYTAPKPPKTATDQAPSVPYDTSLPPGFANLPQTGEIVGAENSWMDARHTLAEKQARLNQLEQSNTATADDITRAKNDVIQAQQSQNQAELRLNDARTKLYETSTKQMKDMSTSMGEIGAALDQDLGISKGLSGMADNLVRFLGSLAAAPLLGQLDALTRAPGQAQGGYGLLGVLGAQGAFGPQYTYAAQQAAQQSASSTTSTTGALPTTSAAGPVGAPQPGESARDFAHRVMMPFWQSQGFTVGDHAADKYGEHQNGALDIMVPNLAAGQQVLQQVLSDPNVYGAIFNNQTYGYGHGLTPQDYSAGHTGDPTQDHMNHVHAWYKPGDPSDITPGPGGGLPGASSTATASSSFGGAGTTPVFVTNWPGDGAGFAGGGGAPRGSAASGQGAGPGPTPGLAPGTTGASGWGTPGLPSSIIGGAGQGPALTPQAGPGMGGAAGIGVNTGGPSVGPTQIGGGAGLQGSGGGIGLTPGGTADTALNLAAAAFPGFGQLAATGVKEVNRAIQFGGQAVGILTQGALDTWLPFGGSELAQNSWFARIIGGLAGAHPTLPNLAGKSSQAAAQPAMQNNQMGAGMGNQTNITVNNNRPTEDGTGRDIAFHAQQMYQPAGMP